MEAQVDISGYGCACEDYYTRLDAYVIVEEGTRVDCNRGFHRDLLGYSPSDPRVPDADKERTIDLPHFSEPSPTNSVKQASVWRLVIIETVGLNLRRTCPFDRAKNSPDLTPVTTCTYD
ncbi:hypothetical protein GCM10027031_15650 [Corynebacterium atrinae]